MNRLITTLSLAIALMIVSDATGQQWTQWHGSSMDGLKQGSENDYPLELSEKTLKFKTPLPGNGSSSPVVFDDIFLTAGVKTKGGDVKQDTVLCYDLDGKEKWRTPLGEERAGKHKNGSGSNPSICASDLHVYAYFKSGTLACLNRKDGEVVWKVNLQEKYGPDSLWWDLGTSPVCADENVVVAVMQEENSFMVAFDQATGEEAWKIDRNYDNEKESGQSYTTPIVYGQQKDQKVLVWGADHLTAYSAKDGSLIWECGGFNPDDEAMWRVIASPVISGSHVFVPYGRGEHVACVKLGGKGDVTKTNRVWELDGLGSDVPTPTAFDNAFYLLGDKGVFQALDVSSGEVLWKNTMPKARGKFYASPVCAPNKESSNSLMFLIRDSGKTYVTQANRKEFKLIHEGDLKERIVATPALAKGMVLVRGSKHLYGFEAK